jgi:predicted DNA-binding antitoxin AbrB/MazE fold protein
MTKVIHAVYEDGVLRPLVELDLEDQQMVKLTLDTMDTNKIGDESKADPLDGIRMKTGLPDLSKNFDDYRFGSQEAEVLEEKGGYQL